MEEILLGSVHVKWQIQISRYVNGSYEIFYLFALLVTTFCFTFIAELISNKFKGRNLEKSKTD